MTLGGKEIIPPEGITSDLFVIRPLLASDVELDYEAVMASRESLRLWEGSTWPEDDFTVADNLKDLETMEKRHNEGYAFGYTILSPAETECLGCIYVMRPEAKMYDGAEITPTGSAQWSDVEATIYFWVRESRLAEGLDRKVLDAIRPWFEQDWDLGPHVIATSEPFAQQVAMIEATDLELQFEIKLADSAGKSLAFD